jgi:hypothetical protein
LFNLQEVSKLKELSLELKDLGTFPFLVQRNTRRLGFGVEVLAASVSLT